MHKMWKLMLTSGAIGISCTVQGRRAKPLLAQPVNAPSASQYVPLNGQPDNGALPLDGNGKRQAVRHHPVTHALPPPAPPSRTRRFGDPLSGLTAAQLAAFTAGLEEFKNVETVESGLGPTFNNTSCVACHFSGATGGASTVTVTRFGRVVNGKYDPLTALGGSLLQAKAIDPAVQEIVPPAANVVAHRQTTPLFGLGLIEAIPDAAIQSNASPLSASPPGVNPLNPNPPNPKANGQRVPPPPQRNPAPLRPRNNNDFYPEDGIQGRVAWVQDVVSGQQRVGRFGWKAQQATLLAFAGDAYLNEMGITNRFFPTENAPNGDTKKLAAFDHTADPEDVVDPTTGRSDIDLAADFMRYLAPPPQLPLTASASAGSAIFQEINCAACHTPTLFTGPNAIAALDRKPVQLYSDLLLHDMGKLGDGIAQAAAGPHEIRTPPLWGLRASAPYLHDGRAATVDEAIMAHDGQAAGARDRYLQLSQQQQQQLLDFLGSI